MNLGVLFIQIMSVNANCRADVTGFRNFPDPVHNLGLQREMMILKLDEKMILVKKRLHFIEIGI